VRVIGFFATAVLAVVAAGVVVTGVRSKDDIKRYLEIRKM